jgi:hypothetical protein
MLLKSTAQALSKYLFGDSSDTESDSADFGNSDQGANISGFDFADFFSLNHFGNLSAFAPDPHANGPSNHGSGDQGQLVLLDDDGHLSPVSSSAAGGSSTHSLTFFRFGGTPAPTLVGSAGGLQFNLIWDSSVASAPAGFESAAIYAASLYTQYYSNPEVINVHIGYGEVDGYRLGQGALGESMSYGYLDSYSQVLSELKGDAGSSTWAAQADSSLPAADPTNGGSFFVSTAEAKALGQISGYGTATDGYIGLSSIYPFDYTPNTTPAFNQYDAVGTFAHELSEVMGRVGSVGSIFGANIYTPLDLFRYSSAGTRDLTAGPGYFSINNGTTNLGTYNNPQNGGDASDWIPTLQGDSYGSGYSGVRAVVSPTDIIENAVLGYHMTQAAVNYTKTPQLA